MKHWLLAFALGIFLTACEKEQLVKTQDCRNAGSPNHPKAEELRDLLRTYTNKGLPGIILLIRSYSGRWSGAAGMADIKGDVKMKPCHVSKVASITKPFIATLVLMLAEDGKLSLDDKVKTYINEDISKVANAQEATIRHLLNHTSGVYDIVSDDDFYLSVLNDPPHEWGAQELLTYLEDDEAYFKPGSDVKYSNTNYLLLSLVIEGATGRSHYKLLREKILDPLKMKNTVYHPQQELPGNTARGYYDLYNNGNIANLTNYNTGNGNGYNGIYSTVYDLQTFIEALFRSRSLLPEERLQQMQTFREAEAYPGIGLGVMQDFPEDSMSRYAVGHSGKDLAYSGEMWYFPQGDLTFISLVNYGFNGDSDLNPVYEAFRDSVVKVLRQ